MVIRGVQAVDHQSVFKSMIRDTTEENLISETDKIWSLYGKNFEQIMTDLNNVISEKKRIITIERSDALSFARFNISPAFSAGAILGLLAKGSIFSNPTLPAILGIFFCFCCFMMSITSLVFDRSAERHQQQLEISERIKHHIFELYLAPEAPKANPPFTLFEEASSS